MTNRAEGPVHVVLAEVPPGTAHDDDESWYTFPDGAADGDLVILVAEARQPAVLDVRTLWIEDDDNWGFSSAQPHVGDGIAMAALEHRLDEHFPIEPRTLTNQAAAGVLGAIAAEVASPTPWTALPHRCLDPRDSEVVQAARSWGCNACGGDAESPYRPRLQVHREPDVKDWPFHESIAVCPSCHDILHQPLGPAFEQLMFSHRPPCPRCSARQTFKLMMGFPPGAPPYGTELGGCVIGPDISSYVCQACQLSW